jgi:homoserine dehydrogenase
MDVPFSEILQEAIDSGFTEPDPREEVEMTWVESY